MSEIEDLRAKILEGVKPLGVDSIAGLLLVAPLKYLDYRAPVSSVRKAKDSKEKILFRAKVVSGPTFDDVARPPRCKLQVNDGYDDISIMVFGAVYPWREVRSGSFIYVKGKPGEWQGNLQIKSAELIQPHHCNKLIPVYRSLSGGPKSEETERYIKVALGHFLAEAVEDVLRNIGQTETEVLRATKFPLPSIAAAISALHAPPDDKTLQLAMAGLRYLNAFYALHKGEGNNAPINHLSVVPIKKDALVALVKSIPFELTNDQKKAIWEITRDLVKNKPMNRLLSGDVGCGKTLAYAVPAVAAHLAGKRVCICIQNSLLATQVANEISTQFPQAKVALMAGNEKIDGELIEESIIVGTSAIAHWLKTKKDYSFDLCIIDEQQKLGATQKEALISEHTNVLEATATPIPKTMAMVSFRGRDISRIEQSPVSKNITTRISTYEDRGDVNDNLKNIVEQGGQIAILYQSVEKNEKKAECWIAADNLTLPIEKVKDHLAQSGANRVTITKKNADNQASGTEISGYNIKAYCLEKDASATARALHDLYVDSTSAHIAGDKYWSVEEAAKAWECLYPGNVAVLHGGLSAQEKNDAMEQLLSGEKKVLVCSTVVEIGITIPNLRGMLVVDAERLGASTLHQLRGRLARHGGEGEFIMSISRSKGKVPEKLLERLKILIDCTSGIEIAERDMQQRGFGSLKASDAQQSGFLDGIIKGLKMNPSDIADFIDHIESKADTTLSI